MIRTKERLNSTNWPRMPIVLPLRITEKKITRRDMSIQSRPWSMPTKRWNGRESPMEHPRNWRGNHERGRRGPERQEPMTSGRQKDPPLGGFGSGAGLGGKVTIFRGMEQIYAQGTPANTLFYIQQGGVRLSTQTEDQPSAVTAILGVNDFFGELCLAGYPLRMSTAVALTDSSIRTIKKENMLEILRKKNKSSNALVAYLLASLKNYRDHVAALLTSNAEQRLARVLLRLAQLDKNGPSVVEIPIVSHQVLAEMIGTTRPRVNLFMNKFRKRGFIHYDGTLEVHESLNEVLRNN